MHAALHQFRVTKYDPSQRNGAGAFLGDDWTSHSDVGRSFNGTTLTEAVYLSMEQAYVETALAFLQEAQVYQLTVVGLENASNITVTPVDGEVLPLSKIAQVLAALLRECYWCKLESESAFVHVGYDYYMYVGLPVACPNAESVAHRNGLFVERFHSPYAKNAV